MPFYVGDVIDLSLNLVRRYILHHQVETANPIAVDLRAERSFIATVEDQIATIKTVSAAQKSEISESDK